jgi:hypothetical protein
MLPLILGGIAALGLLKRNPRRKRRARRNPRQYGPRWAATRKRALQRMVRSLDRGGAEMYHASKWTSKLGIPYKIRQKVLTAAIYRKQNREGRVNPIGRCRVCGRQHVDPMTLNSYPVNKSMCYREETGSDPRCSGYRLDDGTVVNSKQLKRMFMGKLPTPAQRRLLGITKAR